MDGWVAPYDITFFAEGSLMNTRGKLRGEMTLNQTMLSSMARLIAILIVLSLFTVGSRPATGHMFPGLLHIAVHISTFALLAIAMGIGWCRFSAITVFIVVTVIGALDETSEIFTHHHLLETTDILIDAGGAFIGILLQRLAYRWVVLK